MIKVSIILPIYNVEPYLRETLDSLLNQTLRDIEVIAVNDGSADRSEEILREYQAADSRLTYYNQNNQGQSAARNHALQYASGKYIYFMDADDVLDPCALKRCYDYSERMNADIVFFDGDIMQEEGAAPLTWNYKRTHMVEEHRCYGGEELMNLMLDKMKYNCVVWLLFIRKDYLDFTHLKFYEGIIHEDELFTAILMLRSNAIYCLKESYVKHRVRSASTMGARYSKRNINCYLTVIDELLRFQNSSITRKYARYTLSKVFYTGHLLPFREKPRVFLRAVFSGYLRFIGLKSTLVFWLKRRPSVSR